MNEHHISKIVYDILGKWGLRNDTKLKAFADLRIIENGAAHPTEQNAIRYLDLIPNPYHEIVGGSFTTSADDTPTSLHFTAQRYGKSPVTCSMMVAVSYKNPDNWSQSDLRVEASGFFRVETQDDPDTDPQLENIEVNLIPDNHLTAYSNAITAFIDTIQSSIQHQAYIKSISQDPFDEELIEELKNDDPLKERQSQLFISRKNNLSAVYSQLSHIISRICEEKLTADQNQKIILIEDCDVPGSYFCVTVARKGESNFGWVNYIRRGIHQPKLSDMSVLIARDFATPIHGQKQKKRNPNSSINYTTEVDHTGSIGLFNGTDLWGFSIKSLFNSLFQFLEIKPPTSINWDPDHNEPPQPSTY